MKNILNISLNIYWVAVYIYKNSFGGFRLYNGRTSRLEFWLFQIVYGIILCLLVVANDLLLLFTLIATGIFLPSLVACHVRRLHDVEHSGWLLIPKFFYVPWFLFGVRALLQQGVSLNDFLFQESGQTIELVSQFKVMGLFYGGLIYEIILLVSYGQAGTIGNNIYGKDSVIELKNNIELFIAAQKKKRKPKAVAKPRLKKK